MTPVLTVRDVLRLTFDDYHADAIHIAAPVLGFLLSAWVARRVTMRAFRNL